MLSHHRSSVLCLGLALFLVAGCADQGGSSASYAPPSYVALSPVPPPALQEEEVPAIDNPRAQIWRPGYWSYSNGDFSWVSGEMLDRPWPWAVWSSDQWQHRSYGWAFIPGYWQ